MAMNCDQFQEIVHDLGCSGTADFARRAEALIHAESCLGCNALLEEATRLDFALCALAREDRAIQAPPRIEAAVLAAFRHQGGVAVRPHRNFTLGAVLGMAAAVAIAVGIGIAHWGPAKAKTVVNGAIAGTSTPVASNTSVATAGEQHTTTGSPQVAGNVAGGSELATNFILLPYADASSLDGGTVVRVALPRDALASFGVPVADLNPNERIPADIALSVDGVPQAIRLLANADADYAD